MMSETEHLLTCLAEECAEVQQRVTKALRFGLNEVEPGQERTNAQRILDEAIDLLTVVTVCGERGIVLYPTSDEVSAALKLKRAKLARFMEYARERGTLERLP